MTDEIISSYDIPNSFYDLSVERQDEFLATQILSDVHKERILNLIEIGRFTKKIEDLVRKPKVVKKKVVKKVLEV